MGTSPSVITNRRQGKSYTATQSMNVFFDELEQKNNKPKEYLNYSTDALAVVIALIEQGKGLVEITELLETKRNRSLEYYIGIASPAHQTQADKIYKYFAKKHTVRRLKNEMISDWMLAVDEIAENPERINKDSIKILVTLPKFYKENRDLELLMRDYKSVPSKVAMPLVDFDMSIKFVKTIERSALSGKYKDYYWSTPTGHLLRIRQEPSNVGISAWDYISQQGTIKIKGKYCKAVRLQGYDFNILQPIPTMEILSA